MDEDGQPLGRPPQGKADHVITCTICGETFDIRYLGEVLDHLHGQEIPEEPTQH